MEARKLGSAEEPPSPEAYSTPPDEPFSWRVVLRLIHPYVWALIAALWIGLAWLILYEAG